MVRVQAMVRGPGQNAAGQWVLARVYTHANGGGVRPMAWPWTRPTAMSTAHHRGVLLFSLSAWWTDGFASGTLPLVVS